MTDKINANHIYQYLLGNCEESSINNNPYSGEYGIVTEDVSGQNQERIENRGIRKRLENVPVNLQSCTYRGINLLEDNVLLEEYDEDSIYSLDMSIGVPGTSDKFEWHMHVKDRDFYFDIRKIKEIARKAKVGELTLGDLHRIIKTESSICSCSNAFVQRVNELVEANGKAKTVAQQGTENTRVNQPKLFR